MKEKILFISYVFFILLSIIFFGAWLSIGCEIRGIIPSILFFISGITFKIKRDQEIKNDGIMLKALKDYSKSINYYKVKNIIKIKNSIRNRLDAIGV